jgi:soluble lytic murein transglycosylase-like protein
MEVGWNRAYVGHNLSCRGGISRGLGFLVMVLTAVLVVFLFPTRATSPAVSGPDIPAAGLEEVAGPEAFADPVVLAVEDLIARHTPVTRAEGMRIARAVVASARRHDVDPFLVTGILVAESSGDPYAISHRQAVGIMQIHVPTWGAIVETEGLNLFLLEDNIEFGTRIIRDYTRRHGLWDGVMRYLGAREPTDEARAYVQRVRGIYSDRQAD